MGEYWDPSMQEPGAKEDFIKAIKIVSATIIAKIVYDEVIAQNADKRLQA